MTAVQTASWRQRLSSWVDSPTVSRFIIGLILINAVILGLETSPGVMAVVGPGLMLANDIIVGVFVLEIVIKWVALGRGFFRQGWNWFDFIIVGIALVPASGPLEILRALRILRVLRLFSQVPKLRAIIESLMRALPGMGWTALLLILIFYVFGVMATLLFAETHPQYWGSLGRSLFSLFQIMTLESWSSGIARPMIDDYPWIWLFFVPFILISSFMVLNLFIAIIVTATQSIHADEQTEQGEQLLAELKRIDQRLDRMEARSRTDA